MQVGRLVTFFLKRSNCVTAFGNKVATAVLKTGSWWKGRGNLVFAFLRKALVCTLLPRTSSGSAFIYVWSYTSHVSVHIFLLSNLILPIISQINQFHSTLWANAAVPIYNQHALCPRSCILIPLILWCLGLCSKLLVVGGTRVRCWAFTPLPLFLLGSGENTRDPWGQESSLFQGDFKAKHRPKKGRTERSRSSYTQGG